MIKRLPHAKLITTKSVAAALKKLKYQPMQINVRAIPNLPIGIPKKKNYGHVQG